jgi:hypothetical protein
MNARVRPPLAAEPAIRDFTALASGHGNFETGRAEAAIAASAAGRAAYWTTASYHHATACLFVLSANAEGAAAALRTWADPRHPQKTPSRLLSTLVPLNAAAAIELAALRVRQAASAGAGR